MIDHIIYHKGKTCIKANIIMLVSRDKGHILKILYEKSLVYYPKLSFDFEQYKVHQLYFTSDEEIKEGDWVHTPNLPNRPPDIYNTLLKEHSKIDSAYLCKKIIATTDPKLMYLSNNNRVGYPLPTPSQNFIKDYCKLGGINEVLIEVESDCHCHKIESIDGEGCFHCNKSIIHNIKIDQYNNIIIYKC